MLLVGARRRAAAQVRSCRPRAEPAPGSAKAAGEQLPPLPTATAPVVDSTQPAPRPDLVLAGGGRRDAPQPGHEAARVDAWLDAPRGGNDLGRSAVRRIHRPRTGTYSSRPRRATSRLSFCARPKRLSSARKPPSSLRPSSVGASSSAWRRTRPPPGWPQPPAAARRSAEPRASPERRSRASCRRRSTP